MTTDNVVAWLIGFVFGVIGSIINDDFHHGWLFHVSSGVLLGFALVILSNLIERRRARKR